MAVTQNTYTGDGTTVLFSFTFPYLETTDIKVSLDGTITTAYTLANATTIQFNTAPANGAAIRIYRVTDDAALAAQFYPGSAIRSQDLNDNFTQNLYVTQEAVRDSSSSLAQVNSAISTANTASTNASAAVSTANTASSVASSALSTANTASSNASTALSTANTAISTANAAASAVSSSILYDFVANVAAIPGSPSNNDAVEVVDSTGIESFTPLAGKPVGFTGSSGLSVRIIYSTSGATWTWIQYFPNDPESRYLKLAGGTMTGTLGVTAGTAGSPSVFISGDTNTGIYSPGADQIAISTGGTGRLVVDASGRLLVGTSTARANLYNSTVASPVQIEGTSDDNNSLLVVQNSTDQAGPRLDFAKSKGSAVGSNTVVANDDYLGTISFQGSDGSEFVPAAYIEGSVDGTPGTNDMPGRLVFSTTADGASSPQERMRLDSSGNLGLGTSSFPYATGGRTCFEVNGSTSSLLNLKYGDTVGLTIGSSASENAIESNSTLPLVFFANYYERMRITSDGWTLFSTTSTSSTSGVGTKIKNENICSVTNATTNGTTPWTVYSTGASAYRFYLGAGGTVFATNTTISAISDIRYKENILDLDVGLTEILALKPRKFDWKEGKGKNIKGDRGFIAQEFEEVVQDLIDEWKDPAPINEDPYKSVRQDLIPVLVKAIQEQQAMIAELQTKVAALESV